ncbi:MAG: GNAT family N-acetyltransferase [Nocardioidaceae bacterium]
MSFLAAELPPPYECRALETSEATAVTGIINACEVVDFGEPIAELVDIESDWARPSFDLASESIGVTLDGALVAVGEVYQGERAEVYVLPEHRGKGIGSGLLAWTWALTRHRGSRLVGQTIPDSNAGAAALFQSHDYWRRWTSWLLEVPPGGALQWVDPPAGFGIRPFVVGQDEQVTYRVIEDAFDEWPDRLPSTYDDWAPGVLGRPDFEPWQLLLAVEHGAEEKIVGACHLVMSDDGTGWVNQVAVRADRRGRGLAQAMLVRAFDAAHERGATRRELATDSRTGALGLYEHIGMRVRASFTHWAIEVS